MTEGMNKAAVSQARQEHVLGQCCHITLSNGIEAFYLNGHFITDADPADGAPSLLPLARSIARATECALNCYAVHEPDDEAWAWNDVVAGIEPGKREPVDALPPAIFTQDSSPVPRGLLTKLLSLRK